MVLDGVIKLVLCCLSEYDRTFLNVLLAIYKTMDETLIFWSVLRRLKLFFNIVYIKCILKVNIFKTE